jgi:Xaa-Pro dipeptidase
MAVVDAKVPWDREARLRQGGLAFPREEYEARVEKLRREMERAELTHVIAYGNYADAGNITWLSGFFTRHGDSFVVVPIDGEPMLATNWVMHDEPMHSEIWTTWLDDVRPCTPFTYDLAQEVAGAVRTTGSGSRRVGFAGNRVAPAAVLNALASHLDEELIAADDVMSAVRRIKSPLEIETIRRASEITGIGVSTAMALCVPGVTERAASAACHGAMFAAGADYLAFEPAVAGGPQRAGMKHCAPTWRAFEDGDLVFIDTGAIVNGYYCDVSRSVAVGEPTDEGRRLLAAGEILYAELVELAKPGTAIAVLHDHAIRIATDLGYGEHYMPGGFGHGIGCMLFESPSLRYQVTTDVLEPGMTFAFEPMIIVDGLGTACVEDTMLVTEAGIEPLSGLPTEIYSKMSSGT